MKPSDFTQLSFDFTLDHQPEEYPIELLATPPLAKKVLYLAHYIESKKQECNAQLYQNIFDSIKHIG